MINHSSRRTNYLLAITGVFLALLCWGSFATTTFAQGPTPPLPSPPKQIVKFGIKDVKAVYLVYPKIGSPYYKIKLKNKQSVYIELPRIVTMDMPSSTIYNAFKKAGFTGSTRDLERLMNRAKVIIKNNGNLKKMSAAESNTAGSTDRQLALAEIYSKAVTIQSQLNALRN